MDLVERASRLTLDQRREEQEELERAEEVLLAKARELVEPFKLKDLERAVTTQEGLSEDAVSRAFGDLLIDGVFRMYDGDGDGDMISSFRRR